MSGRNSKVARHSRLSLRESNVLYILRAISSQREFMVTRRVGEGREHQVAQSLADASGYHRRSASPLDDFTASPRKATMLRNTVT